MASSVSVITYIVEQLQEAGTIQYRRMFGEYGIYCNGKFVAVVCDDQLFVKITGLGLRLFPDLPTAPPYAGAKDYFWVEDVDNRDLLENLVRATCTALPEPKPKKRRN